MANAQLTSPPALRRRSERYPTFFTQRLMEISKQTFYDFQFLLQRCFNFRRIPDAVDNLADKGRVHAEFPRNPCVPPPEMG